MNVTRRALHDETDRGLRDVIMRAESMGLFPAEAARIQTVAEDRRSSLGDLERIACRDPVLSASLLRLANSAFYGMRRRVGSLRQAIFVLGFKTTRDVALALALASLGRSKHPLRSELWDRSLRGAAAARAVAEVQGSGMGSEAFVSALLRDLGRVLLLEVAGDGYASLKGEDKEVLDLEHETYGFDHALLGATFLERWGLPDETCAAIGAHHSPPTEPGIGAVVWVADVIERHTWRAGPGDAQLEATLEPGAAALGLPEGWLETTLQAM